MADPTTRNRLKKIAAGAENNTWGLSLNTSVFDLVDAALDGLTTIATGDLTSGAITLSSNNYVADQSRMRMLNVTANITATVTIPSVEKWYIVRAATNDVIVTTGGLTTATVTGGDIALVMCDGAAVRKVQSSNFTGLTTVDFGSARLTNVGTPTANYDASTKKYVDDTAFAASSGTFPGLTANGGRFLQVAAGETTVQWDLGAQKKTANFTAARGGTYPVDTTSGVVTAALATGGQVGDQITFCDGGYTSSSSSGWALNKLTIARGSYTIMGLSEDMDCQVRGASFTLYLATATDWRIKA